MTKKIMLLALIFLCVDSSVIACSCVTSPRRQFRQARMIFVGTVTEIVNDDLLIFQVEKSYKGNAPSNVQLHQDEYPELHRLQTNCSMFFKKGDKYLVFATSKEIRGERLLLTDICDGTSEFTPENEKAKWLENNKYLQNRINRKPKKTSHSAGV